ncbi:hypothetical protein FKM82_022924 [Ascaphus truei]
MIIIIYIIKVTSTQLNADPYNSGWCHDVCVPSGQWQNLLKSTNNSFLGHSGTHDYKLIRNPIWHWLYDEGYFSNNAINNNKPNSW